MRTTIDIPDDIYRKLKIKAAIEGRSLRQIALQGIDREIAEPVVESSQQTSDLRMQENSVPLSQAPRKRFQIPVIRSSRPGTLDIDNETIYDLIDFP